MRFTLFLSLFLLFTSCDSKNQEEIFSKEIIELKGTNYTKGFFNGERIKDYNIDVRSYSGYTAYRLKSRIKSDTAAVLNLSILVNNIHSTTEIRVEPNKQFPHKEGFKILWKSKDGKSGLVEFKPENRKDHLSFASQTYDKIEEQSEFFLKTTEGDLPILVSQESRDAFHITMIDYYGLASVN